MMIDLSPTRRVRSTIGAAALVLAIATGLTTTPAAQGADGAAPKAAAGKVDALAVYQQRCQACHMADGNSQIMPNMSFADGVWKHGSTVKAVETTITNGVPGTAMVAWKEVLSPAEISALARFVRKFDKKLK